MNTGKQGFPPTSLVISVSCSLLVQWLSSSTYLHFTNAACSDKQEQQLWWLMLCDCHHDGFFWLLFNFALGNKVFLFIGVYVHL